MGLVKQSVCLKSASAAFSLMEVVIGLTLMATVLVSTLLAYGSHTHKQSYAKQKLRAVQLADQVLLELTSRRDGVPSSQRGAIIRNPGWYWQTRLIGNTRPMGVLMQVIRVEILKQGEDGKLTSLVSLDIVEPIP